MATLEDLIGATVTEVAHTSEVVTLTTDRGTFKLLAEGDCCSVSWFEHVDDDGIAGGVVTRVEDSGEPEGWVEPADNSEHEVLQYYFTTISTTKGRLMFEMRNSSNGYYGGFIAVSVEANSGT